MCKCISDGVGFRTLQSISDLRAVAHLAGRATLARIAAGTDGPDAEDDLARLIGLDGCRIVAPTTLRLHQALVLSAALPNDDYDAFVTATAILVADRLQCGLGNDDLFWHWDAFRDHYRLAPPAIRAVLMHGFVRMEVEGRVTLQDPPEDADLLSEQTEAVTAALRESGDPAATPILAALEGGVPDHDFWIGYCRPHLSSLSRASDPLLRAIRHLFETHPDWEPYAGETFVPSLVHPPVIPLVQP